MIEYSDGSKYWFLNRELHRENGPAVEYPNGSKIWYINGQRHREDGPAIERFDGTKEWWLNNKQLVEKELLSEEMKIDYPEIYNSYLVHQIMNS